MKFNIHYGSHLPVLMRAINMTDGPVLEIGTGLFSTPVLHWLCSPHKRLLVSYEVDYGVYQEVKQFEDEYHKVIFVENWDKAPIEVDWDVALIDHNPAERRIVEIKRLADSARYIVVHDTHPRNYKDYHYPDIFPLFSYRYDYMEYPPYCTTILSNFANLVDFKV